MTRRASGRTSWAGSDNEEKEIVRGFSMTSVLRSLVEVVPGGRIRAGKQSYGDTRTGFWLGIDADGLAKFDLGSSSFYLRWTGTELLIRGNISFTGHSTWADYEAIKWVDSTGAIRAQIYSDVYEPPNFQPAHRLVLDSKSIEGADSFVWIDARAAADQNSQIDLYAESGDNWSGLTAYVTQELSIISLNTNTDLGGLDIELDLTTYETATRIRTDKQGFFGATPATKQTLSAYTADTEGSAYTGIDNTQAGTVYATVADLNALRTAYETLRAAHDDLRTKLQTTTLIA